MSVTLPIELADQVRRRVKSGDYASDSEVIREGLRALAEREKAVEHWLHTDVVAAYDALHADPARARSITQVRETLLQMRAPATQE